MLPRPDEGPGAQLYYPLPCSLSEPELDQLLHRELGAGLDVDPDTSVTPGLTKAEALAMIGQADRARGAQQERVAAIITVMLFTGARVSEVCGADIEDLGVDRGHRELWVTRKGGKRQALALPAPATERLDIYLPPSVAFSAPVRGQSVAVRGLVRARPWAAQPPKPGAHGHIADGSGPGTRFARRMRWSAAWNSGRRNGL